MKPLPPGTNDQSDIYFTCLWRKTQTRKKKTWEGDGILHIRGSDCVLNSREDGTQVASGPWLTGDDCMPGKVYRIGNKEIEIDQPISREDLEKERQPVHSSNMPSPSLQTPQVLAKIDLKFKPPIRRTPATQPLSSTPACKSRFFTESALSRPFNAPRHKAIHPDGLKRTREEDSPQQETGGDTIGTAIKKSRHLLPGPSRTMPADKSTLPGPTPTQAFVCLHRKLKSSNFPAKSSSWDGDGMLCFEALQNGPMVVLKDSNSRKSLGSLPLGLVPDLRSGSTFRIGFREVEVQGSMTEAQLLDFEGNSQESSKTGWTDVVKGNPIIASFRNPMIKSSSLPRRPKFDPHAEGALVLTRPSETWRLQRNLQIDDVVDVVVDPFIARSLRPHQIDGLKFMYECTMGLREVGGHGCILADEMGLGKSIQAISLLWTLLRQTPIAGERSVIQRAMIVCPVTLVKNWTREIYKWLGRSQLNVFAASGKSKIEQFINCRQYEVLVVGYERVRTLSKLLNGCQPPIGLVIADEGHRLRSIEAKTTQALRSLKTQRRVVLSGTPIQNNLTEYYAMIDFVNPGILEDYRTFKTKFEQPILKSREPYCNPVQKKHGEAQAEELAKMSRNYVLRRGSEVIKEHLPPRHDYCVFISSTMVQKNIYEAILDSPEIRNVFSGDTSQHLVLINILKQLCNSAGLLMNEYSIRSLQQNSSKLFPAWVTRDDIRLSGKLIALSKFLAVLRRKSEEKIIVVSNFTQTLDIIESHCKASNYPFCRLDGKTLQNQRDDIVQAFNRSSARAQFIFLLSSKSGGVGLNLIGASRLILFDGDWNPATDLQAMARIWRQGQQKTCHIYRFLTTGTIDECIFQRQMTKIGLATDLMSDPTADEENKSGGNTFTKSELKRLFEFHSGTSCYTHDLLECQCQENKPAEESESWVDEEQYEEPTASTDQLDSEDSLPDLAWGGFLPASRFKLSEKPEVLKIKRKLVELEKWTHINPLDRKSRDDLEDEILLAAISSLNPNLNELDNLNQGDQAHPDGAITFVFTKSNG